MPNDFWVYFTYGNDMLQDISTIISFHVIHSHRAQTAISEILNSHNLKKYQV